MTYIEQMPFMGILVITLAVWCVFMQLYHRINREYPNISHAFWLLLSSGYASIFIVLYLWPVSFRALSPDCYIGRVQLIPFHTIMQTSCLHTVGNLAVPFFMPFFLRYNFYRESVKKTMLCSFFIAAMIEPAQFMINQCTRFPNFVVDIDDCILQVTGCAIGIGVIAIRRRVLRKGQSDKCRHSGKAIK